MGFVRGDLRSLLDRRGLRDGYDFLYLPMKFAQGASLGFAFVNFTSNEVANLAFRQLDGFADLGAGCCQAAWCEDIQGLDANILRFRNSSVMHKSVPHEFRPLLFRNGVVVEFPASTVKIAAPRTRSAKGAPNC